MADQDAPRLASEEDAIDAAFALMATDEEYQVEALALAEAFLADEWLILCESESDDSAEARERGDR